MLRVDRSSVDQLASACASIGSCSPMARHPAQMVSPLEAKLIHVEAGKARDRGVERFAL